MKSGMRIMNWYTFFIRKRIISAVKRVDSGSDGMSYIILRDGWCGIFVLYDHAPTGYRADDVKGSSYQEIERVFDKFPKYRMKILLGDFNDKVSREVILKPTIGNESIYKISFDNGVRIVNFVTSKNLSEVQCSHIVTFVNTHEHLLMVGLKIKLTIF
jgi:hypothetical protein